MEKRKCGYCNRYYDVQDEMTLENGSPACPNALQMRKCGKKNGRRERKMTLAKKTLCLLFVFALCFQYVACASGTKSIAKEEPTATPGITAIYLNKNSIEMEIAETYQLQYTVMPETVTGYTLSWKSTDTSVATVDSMGWIKAVASGSTRIICSTPDGITDVCEITVKKPSAIEQLNENEKKAFDCLVENVLESFYNPSAIRIKKFYYSGSTGKESFRSGTFSFIMDLEGTNKVGGTISALYWVLQLKETVLCLPAGSSSDLSCPMETSVMDPGKINAALEEYWETQHR